MVIAYASRRRRHSISSLSFSPSLLSVATINTARLRHITSSYRLLLLPHTCIILICIIIRHNELFTPCFHIRVVVNTPRRYHAIACSHAATRFTVYYYHACHQQYMAVATTPLSLLFHYYYRLFISLLLEMLYCFTVAACYWSITVCHLLPHY